MQNNNNHTAEDAELRSFYNMRLARVWGSIGVLIILALIFFLMGKFSQVVIFMGTGLIVGFMCSSIVNWLERHKIQRSFGALIALVIIFVVIGGIFAFLGPAITEQFVSLMQKFPNYLKEFQAFIMDIVKRYGLDSNPQIQTNLSSILTTVTSSLSSFAMDIVAKISSGIIPNVMNLANTVFMLFLGLIFAYWLAIDYPKIVREIAIIAGPRHENDVTLLLAVTSRSMGGYMKGMLITGLINGVLVFIGLLIAGYPYAPLMAVLTGIFHFIPVVGSFASAAIATIIGFFVDPLLALWTLIICVLAQNVTDNVISPMVMKRAVSVHPAVSLLAVVIGSAIAGPIGMTLSVPISAALTGVFVYYFETKTNRQIVQYDGAIFQGTPFHFEDGSPVPFVDALTDEHFYETSKLTQPNAEYAKVSATPRPADKREPFDFSKIYKMAIKPENKEDKTEK